MKKLLIFICICICFLVSFGLRDQMPAWGFFGHKLINRMAIFTLPEEMLPLFKTEIEYITEHAVDPDKRRYATEHEGIRHYIDIDHWGKYPFESVPRTYTDALIKYTDILLVSGSDTTVLEPDWDVGSSLVSFQVKGNLIEPRRISCAYELYRGFYMVEVLSQYYDKVKKVSSQSISSLFDIKIDSSYTIFIRDNFSVYGILPYYLSEMYWGLVHDFKKGQAKQILRRGTDLGHYIADAHVPLHTTENYNGQFTDQIGIHAFWESRLPELFALSEYDFFVGQAEYIEDKRAYFWKIVLESHALLEEVLGIEKRVRMAMPQDMITCFEDRLGRNVQVPCASFSRAYHNQMHGMVESRMRAAILSLGDVWYSAWVDAGKPDMSMIAKNKVAWTTEELEEQKALDLKNQTESIKGRPHDH